MAKNTKKKNKKKMMLCKIVKWQQIVVAAYKLRLPLVTMIIIIIININIIRMQACGEVLIGQHGCNGRSVYESIPRIFVGYR